MKHHYRSPIEFEVEEVKAPDGTPIGVRFHSLEAADRDLEYFYVTLQKLDELLATGDGGEGAVLPEAEKLVPSAREALADDINTPKVMAALHEAAALANKLLASGKGIDKQLRRRTLARLARDIRAVGDALGILANDPTAYLRDRRERLVRRKNIDVARVEALMTERAAARAAKDFTRSDAIRAELQAMGIELLDTPQGTDWRVHDDAS